MSFENIVQELTPRCAKAISGAFNLVTQPFVDGAKYAGSAGEKSVSGLVDHMFGAEEGAITNFKVGDHNLNGAKIAGAAAGLGIGYRFASGGGVYRDKDGNTDIAGVPFV